MSQSYDNSSSLHRKMSGCHTFAETQVCLADYEGYQLLEKLIGLAERTLAHPPEGWCRYDSLDVRVARIHLFQTQIAGASKAMRYAQSEARALFGAAVCEDAAYCLAQAISEHVDHKNADLFRPDRINALAEGGLDALRKGADPTSPSVEARKKLWEAEDGQI